MSALNPPPFEPLSKKQRLEQKEAPARLFKMPPLYQAFAHALPNDAHTLIWSYLTLQERVKVLKTSQWGAAFFKKNVYFLKKEDEQNFLKAARHSAEYLRTLFNDPYPLLEQQQKRTTAERKKYLLYVLEKQVFKYPEAFFQVALMQFLIEAVHSQEEETEIFTGLLLPVLNVSLLRLLMQFKQDGALDYLLKNNHLESFYLTTYSPEEAREALTQLPILTLQSGLTARQLPILLMYVELLIESMQTQHHPFIGYLIGLIKNRFHHTFIFQETAPTQATTAIVSPSPF